MPTKKKEPAAPKKAERKGGPSTDDPTLMDPAAMPQQIGVDDGSTEPHDVNTSLSSDRMQALLADHRAMGSRP